MYVLLFYYHIKSFHGYGLCGFMPLGMGKNLWSVKNLTSLVGLEGKLWWNLLVA